MSENLVHYSNAPIGAPTMDGLLMKYFVLKPMGDDVYARASRKAMRSYADTIRSDNPVFAAELREWADREGAEAHGRAAELRDDAT